jgi:hypothetical protein
MRLDIIYDGRHNTMMMVIMYKMRTAVVRGAPPGRLHRHRKSAAIVSSHSAGCHGVTQQVFDEREERQHQ